MSAARPLRARFRASLEDEYIMRGLSPSVSFRPQQTSPSLHGCAGETHVLRRIIGAPADEGNLVSHALAALEIVLDVVDGVAAADALLASTVLALGADQLLTKDGPVILGRGLLDDDLFPVIANLVDDPLCALAQLEIVEGGDALGRDRDTARGISIWPV